MTALDRYQRLEATGLWRAHDTAQRREVVVSLGDATLKIADMSDRVLTHWSLAAMLRVNPGQYPALYHPDGDPSETLELGADETAMIEAIAHIQRVVARRKANPGRLRLWFGLAILALFIAVSVFWLPIGLRSYALRVVPESQRAELGIELLTRLERAAGQPCETGASAAVLSRLAQRTGAGRILVLRGGTTDALHLPGGIVVLTRELVEDHSDPAVPAGYVLAELQRGADMDPLENVLDATGLRGTLALLTTGTLPDAILDRHGEVLLTRAPQPIDDGELLVRFAVAGLPSTPYALALDITGETTETLIAGDPIEDGDTFVPALSDADWLRLQVICETSE